MPTMIEQHGLFNISIGYTDANLLASVLLEHGLVLWTRDKRLSVAAEKSGARLHTPSTTANCRAQSRHMLDGQFGGSCSAEVK